MRSRNVPAFVLALLLLLLCAPLALAQLPDSDTSGAAGAFAGAAVLIWGCACAAVLVGIAIKVAICVFIWKDTQARGTDPVMWLVLAIFFDIIVLIVWLIVRPPLGSGPVGGPPGY